MANVTLTYSIPIGSKLRIGYRPQGSSGAFTYLSVTPTDQQSPYTFTLNAGDYELELTTVCPNCSGNTFSNVTLFNISVP